MRIFHSSCDNLPFRNSASISSATGSDPGTETVSFEELVGFDIIQPVLLYRSSLPQTICLYQFGIWNCTDSSRVNCKSALSSGLGPVLILAYPLNRRSLSKNSYQNSVCNIMHLVEKTSNFPPGTSYYDAKGVAIQWS